MATTTQWRELSARMHQEMRTTWKKVKTMRLGSQSSLQDKCLRWSPDTSCWYRWLGNQEEEMAAWVLLATLQYSVLLCFNQFSYHSEAASLRGRLFSVVESNNIPHNLSLWRLHKLTSGEASSCWSCPLPFSDAASCWLLSSLFTRHYTSLPI